MLSSVRPLTEGSGERNPSWPHPLQGDPSVYHSRWGPWEHPRRGSFRESSSVAKHLSTFSLFASDGTISTGAKAQLQALRFTAMAGAVEREEGCREGEPSAGCELRVRTAKGMRGAE